MATQTAATRTTARRSSHGKRRQTQCWTSSIVHPSFLFCRHRTQGLLKLGRMDVAQSSHCQTNTMCLKGSTRTNPIVTMTALTMTNLIVTMTTLTTTKPIVTMTALTMTKLIVTMTKPIVTMTKPIVTTAKPIMTMTTLGQAMVYPKNLWIRHWQNTWS